jgi:hypothetical protein
VYNRITDFLFMEKTMKKHDVDNLVFLVAVDCLIVVAVGLLFGII